MEHVVIMRERIDSIAPCCCCSLLPAARLASWWPSMDASISLRDSQREQETKRVALMETNGRTVQQQEQHSVFIRSLSLLYIYVFHSLFLPLIPSLLFLSVVTLLLPVVRSQSAADETLTLIIMADESSHRIYVIYRTGSPSSIFDIHPLLSIPFFDRRLSL
jgi:hypothetical protein